MLQIALVFVILPSLGVTQSAPMPSKASVDSVVSHFFSEQRLPGLSVAVASKGAIQYIGVFGLADLENHVPVMPETVFRIASVTKPITATLIMKLVEQGKLNLDSPIQQFCQSYAEKPWPVTLRLLLAHLGGVRDYQLVERGVWWIRTPDGNEEGSNSHHYDTISEVIPFFAEDSLVAQPGSKFQYSNVGYLLAGCAIEGVSGKFFAEVLRSEILLPADMQRTMIDDSYEIIKNRARPYQMRTKTNANFWWWTRAQKKEMEVDRLYNARFDDNSLKQSAGGLLSTPTDLVKFGIAVLNGTLIGPETRKEMFAAQFTATGDSTGWGLGWGVGAAAGEGTVGLSGGQPGASAILRLVPEKSLVIAAITNRDMVALQPLIMNLGRMWGSFTVGK
ncbi:MAG: serine hydrolase domain-containing protein [Bacteroidota bacterium]